MPRNFADRLLDKIDEMGNPSCVGLDPRIRDIPRTICQDSIKSVLDKSRKNLEDLTLEEMFQATGRAIFEFNREIIDKTIGTVGIYKPQMAFYEQYGNSGVNAFEKTVKYAKIKGAIVIEDAKRNDIKDTAEAYADGHLGVVELADGSFHSSIDVDAITINGYLGSDGVKPFVDVSKKHGKGFFLLAKTSNTSSGELQDLLLDERHGARKVYEQMALKTHLWGEELVGERGYSSAGIVVGATYPEDAVRCRSLAERAIILVPGYGQQGGRGKDVIPNFNKDGYGAVINSSRGIIFAYLSRDFKMPPENFGEAAQKSAEAMKEDIVNAMKDAGIK